MNCYDISVADEMDGKGNFNGGSLKHLPKWPPVNIEFQDLTYTVPELSCNKVILRGINGKFKSSQLTAIMGPSGAGKSTLLNILAGYKCSEATGTISINNRQRDMRIFRKMSRYIMQEDIYQPMLTVREAMLISADLKLGKQLTKDEKLDVIDEILDLLRLNKAKDTMGHKLSGGERKRLSIALELVNNPPVIFLDEPTTSQCVSLLQRIAHGGRTVICSIHTPSAKMFAMFDHVYIMANGQCVYQGLGECQLVDLFMKKKINTHWFGLQNEPINPFVMNCYDISVADEMDGKGNFNGGSLKHLPKWPPVNIEFQDLTYTVPELSCNKVILRGINGKFKSSQLTAIMGPSGAGKSTLLNILAGYKEAMLISADLKLGKQLTKDEKLDVIDEILDLLRLNKAKDTMGHKLSGGERKRLSIALELVNNPPVIFLDEPTTGLDDLSSSQCVSLLQRIAHGGRTVICSIHTPSAKMFAMFDHVYIMANGQFVEVSGGEYGGEYLEKMVSSVGNGRYTWTPSIGLAKDNEGSQELESSAEIESFDIEINPKELKARASSWQQFCILFRRMTIQMWRDKSYLMLRVYLHIFLGFVIGGLFYNMGNDASKTLYNFGFCFTIIIAFMYIPMMPILLEFPLQVQLLKREYFNRWYRLNVYYMALVVAKLPIQITLAIVYITMVYLFTDQPISAYRMLMFYTISILVSLTSESWGLLVASRLRVVNAMFVGPVITVPTMLLAVYGIGFGKGVVIPSYIKALMSISYLRYGLEGIVAAIYGYSRDDMICPDEEVFCAYRKAKFLLVTMGFEEISYPISAGALCVFYLVFNILAFLLIRQRLSLRRTNFPAVQYIGQFVKQHLNLSSN
uniref:Putative pleiotropic drug resistance pdr1-15 abc superfamily protein n=1 Tax=Lutzomyia longipalpis TaxID=7200 RepID=A0A1B0CSM0_LUTLO